MNASDHWSITFGCPKTRSSEKLFIEARKTFRKRSEDNYFNRVAYSIILCLNLTVLLTIHHTKFHFSFEEK